MINNEDKNIIISWAKTFGVKEIYLFGSSLESEIDAQDIDIAVRGITPTVFFDFCGKLLRYLSKPVDIVNLSTTSRFTKLIGQDAVKIYG